MLIFFLQLYWICVLVLPVFWWSHWSFLYIKLCQMQTETTYFLLFDLDAFYFLFPLDCSAEDFQYSTEYDESRHTCPVPDVRGKSFNISLLNIMLSVGLSYMSCIMLRFFLSMTNMIPVFVINGCWILLSAFSNLLRWLCDLIFILLSITVAYHIC